ncbi:MAG: TlpA family protein disulfide reductase [Chloroflexota bacterium]
MSIHYVWFTLAVIAAALFGTGCSGPEGSVMIGDRPPRVVLSVLNGGTISVPDDLKGRVAIIHFWTEGCSSCMREMPEMESLYSTHKDKGLSIIAVNVGQEAEAVDAAIRKLNVTYTVVVDKDGKVSRKYHVSALPRTFFLDRNGVVRYSLFGEANEDLLTQLVHKLL